MTELTMYDISGAPPSVVFGDQWHDFLLKGSEPGSIDLLKAKLEVSDDVLSPLLGVSEKTLARTRKSRARLDPGISDRLYRVAKVAALAVDVFEKHEAALSWLKRKQPGLGGRTPLSLLSTSAGIEMVEQLLHRIEYGVYS